MSRACVGLVVLILALLLSPLPVWARWMAPPQDVPVERLEENVKGYIQQNPADPHGYYVLGRLYSIAYARRNAPFSDVHFGTDDRLPGMGILESRLSTFLPVPDDQWREEVREAYAAGCCELTDEQKESLERLIAFLDDDDYRVREEAHMKIRFMGPGVLPVLREKLEGGVLSAEQRSRVEEIVASVEGPAEGAKHLRKSIEYYTKAVELDPACALARLGLAWCWEEAGETEEAVKVYRRAYEAGERLLKLLEVTGDEAGLDAILAKVEELRQTVVSGPRKITPILVPLEPIESLGDLLDPSRVASFDLDGDGLAREWPWVRPSAGFLVWDPRGTGRVTSGRQLFGSVTWDIFWRDGSSS